jgi:hypothetical protein
LRSTAHRSPRNSLFATLPLKCGTCALCLAWSLHSVPQSVQSCSGSFRCRRSNRSAWYSRCLGVRIYRITLSGEAWHKHSLHTCSSFSPSLHLYLTQILY